LLGSRQPGQEPWRHQLDAEQEVRQEQEAQARQVRQQEAEAEVIAARTTTTGASKPMTTAKAPKRPRRALATLTLSALAVFAWAVLAPSANADVSDYGLQSVSASETSSQAGAHPDLTIGFHVKLDANNSPFAQTKEVKIELPPGLIGDPQGYP